MPKKIFPKSRRYCMVCQKETLFKYNPARFHSDCEECGNPYSINVSKLEVIKRMKTEVEKERENIKKQKEKLRDRFIELEKEYVKKNADVLRKNKVLGKEIRILQNRLEKIKERKNAKEKM